MILTEYSELHSTTKGRRRKWNHSSTPSWQISNYNLVVLHKFYKNYISSFFYFSSSIYLCGTLTYMYANWIFFLWYQIHGICSKIFQIFEFSINIDTFSFSLLLYIRIIIFSLLYLTEKCFFGGNISLSQTFDIKFIYGASFKWPFNPAIHNPLCTCITPSNNLLELFQNGLPPRLYNKGQ